MDDVVAHAVGIVRHSSTSEAHRWFTAVCTAHDESGGDWARFAEHLSAQAAGSFPDDEVRQFLDAVESAGGIGVVGDMVGLGPDRLTAEYETAAADPGAEPAGYDEQAWVAFLAENGPRWNGDEASWEQFAAWFLHTAGEAGVGEPAGSLLEYLSGVPDKVAEFGRYGVVIDVAVVEDEARWNTYLAENGPFWNGSPETWGQFRDWFLHYAREAGVGTTAGGFVEYVEQHSDPVAAFAEYGITPAAAPRPDDAGQVLHRLEQELIGPLVERLAGDLPGLGAGEREHLVRRAVAARLGDGTGGA